jgi:hypothetical protein
MRHRKVFGLAVLVAVLVTALAGAGAVSATVLCKKAINPCGAMDYPALTEFSASLQKETSVEFRTTEATRLAACSGSSMELQTTKTGGALATVPVSFSRLLFSGCTSRVVSIELGSLEIHSIAGTVNGTVTVKKAEITSKRWLGAATTPAAKNGFTSGFSKADSQELWTPVLFSTRHRTSPSARQPSFGKVDTRSPIWNWESTLSQADTNARKAADLLPSAVRLISTPPASRG